MEDYKKLVEQLRSTVSVSKRKMLDEAAAAIEALQRQLAHKEEIRKQQAKTIMGLRAALHIFPRCLAPSGFDTAASQAEKDLLQMERMTLGNAYAIFANIDTVELADEVKGLAVWKVANMETHNGVTKDRMVKVIRWLLGLCFDATEEA